MWRTHGKKTSQEQAVTARTIQGCSTLSASTGGAPEEGSSQKQSRGWTNWSSRPHTDGGIVWVPLLETIKLYKLCEISTITFTVECITAFLAYMLLFQIKLGRVYYFFYKLYRDQEHKQLVININIYHTCPIHLL